MCPLVPNPLFGTVSRDWGSINYTFLLSAGSWSGSANERQGKDQRPEKPEALLLPIYSLFPSLCPAHEACYFSTGEPVALEHLAPAPQGLSPEPEAGDKGSSLLFWIVYESRFIYDMDKTPGRSSADVYTQVFKI